MIPERVQRRRTKGWKMPPNTVSVTRPGRWGNPYPVKEYGLVLSLNLFRNTMRGFWTPDLVTHLADPLFDLTYRRHCDFRARLGCHPMEAIHELRGKNMACWCSLRESDCHADILLELANK